jgi:putative flippase GtrA
MVRQIRNFLIVGGVAFFIDYSILFGMTSILGINYLIANCISFTISMIVNYILNLKFVFKADDNNINNFLKFIIIAILGLIINQIVMWVLTTNIGVYYLTSKIVATLLVMIWNFIMRKIFLEKREDSDRYSKIQN